MSSFVQQVSQANLYLQPTQLFLSIILNTITIRILYTPSLRRSPCTYYLLAYAVFSIIYMSMVCLRQFLLAYNINIQTNLFPCKLVSLILSLPGILIRLMLLLASFDRFCSSSNSNWLRSKSTIRKAKRYIVTVTVVTTITMLPILIVYYWNETFHICQTYTDLAALIFVFGQVIFINVIAPLVMTIFGCLTIYNIRQNSIRVRAQGILQSNRRTEGQLARMLILQIAVIIITTVPYMTIFTINTIYPSTLTPNMVAIRSITVLIVQSQFYTSFFLYTISGEIYRKEFIKIVRKIGLLRGSAHQNGTIILN